MSDSGTFWSCEAARSGRSACADCKEKIDKDDIRIGVTFDVKGHDYQMTKWRHLYNCFNPSRHPSFDVSELIFEDPSIKDDICAFIEARATSAPSTAKVVAAKKKRQARDSDDDDSDEELDKVSPLPSKVSPLPPKKKAKATKAEAPKMKAPVKKLKQKKGPTKEQEASAAALVDVMKASARTARDERKARRDAPAHLAEAS